MIRFDWSILETGVIVRSLQRLLRLKTIRGAATTQKTIGEAVELPRRLLRHKKRSVRSPQRLLRLKTIPKAATTQKMIGEAVELPRRLLRHKKQSVEAIELSPPHMRLLNTAQRYVRLLQTRLQQEKSDAAPYRVATQKQEMKNNLKSTIRNKFSILFSIYFIL